MGLLSRIFLALLLVNASVSVRVTLEGGKTGTAVKTKVQNTAVTLACSASGNGGSPSLEWTYDTSPNSAGTHLVYNTQLVEGVDTRISITNPYSLTISSLKSSDTGFYTCRVVIPGDVPSVDAATYNFTVLVPPDEDISCGFPGDLKITLGQSPSFRCQEVAAQAVPAPTYTWFKNGIPLPTSRAGNPMYNNASFSYSKTTGVLTFSSVVAGDEGTYHCEARNEVGSATCQAASITTKNVNVGAIVGIVFGVIFALILIGVLIWWTWKKGYCEGWFDGGKDHEEDAHDEGANDIMLDGAGPLVTKEPSEWSNGTSNKPSNQGPLLPPDRRMPEGAVRVMP